MDDLDAEAIERIEDDKYVTFKRSDLYEMLGLLGLPPWSDGKGEPVGGKLDCAVLAKQIEAAVDDYRLRDSVVIRRQDLFAGPALATYASCIALVARTTSDDEVRTRLLAVSDYFHQQSVVAGEEGWKLPD